MRAKPIDGYGRYWITDDGRVWSTITRKWLKTSKNERGYLAIELFNDDGSKRLLVHRLVANAFIPNPEHLPFINHIDENPSNPNANNLEWCTASYNQRYGTAIERRKKHTDYTKPSYAINARINGAIVSRPVEQYTKDGKLIARYCSGKEAHRQTGINHSHILECCAGKRYKTVGGYVWRYVKE